MRGREIREGIFATCCGKIWRIKNADATIVTMTSFRKPHYDARTQLRMMHDASAIGKLGFKRLATS